MKHHQPIFLNNSTEISIIIKPRDGLAINNNNYPLKHPYYKSNSCKKFGENIGSGKLVTNLLVDISIFPSPFSTFS